MTPSFPDEILAAGTKCPANFSCQQSSQCGDRKMCDVKSVGGANVLFLHTKEPMPCPYRLRFGARQTCTCPVHFEIYRRQQLRMTTPGVEQKVLLVDDEPQILELLGRLLSLYGYSPRTATNGEKALEIMGRDHVQVFLLDLRMPTMNGIELCRRIKQIDPGAIVYAVSAFGKAYSAEQLRHVGFEGWFPKPFPFDDILDACHGAFDRLKRCAKEGGHAHGVHTAEGLA